MAQQQNGRERGVQQACVRQERASALVVPLDEAIATVVVDTRNFGGGGIATKAAIYLDDTLVDWWERSVDDAARIGLLASPWRESGVPLLVLQAFCSFLVDVHVRGLALSHCRLDHCPLEISATPGYLLSDCFPDWRSLAGHRRRTLSFLKRARPTTCRCPRAQGQRREPAALGGAAERPVVGYKVGTTMQAVVRAIRHAHMHRGIAMNDGVYLALRHHVFVTLARKVRASMLGPRPLPGACAHVH